MSPFIILAIVFALGVLAAIIFVAVVVAIHSEPRPALPTRARGPLTVMVRRMLGVHVARPTKTAPRTPAKSA